MSGTSGQPYGGHEDGYSACSFLNTCDLNPVHPETAVVAHQIANKLGEQGQVVWLCLGHCDDEFEASH